MPSPESWGCPGIPWGDRTSVSGLTLLSPTQMAADGLQSKGRVGQDGQRAPISPVCPSRRTRRTLARKRSRKPQGVDSTAGRHPPSSTGGGSLAPVTQLQDEGQNPSAGVSVGYRTPLKRPVTPPVHRTQVGGRWRAIPELGCSPEPTPAPDLPRHLFNDHLPSPCRVPPRQGLSPEENQLLLRAMARKAAASRQPGHPGPVLALKNHGHLLPILSSPGSPAP